MTITLIGFRKYLSKSAQVVRWVRTSCPEFPDKQSGGSEQTVSKLSIDFETGSIMLWCNSVSDYKFTKKSAKHQISRSFLTVFLPLFLYFSPFVFPFYPFICHLSPYLSPLNALSYNSIVRGDR